jgi:ferric-dicitrate binding protein FerR (iron transport regulator)
MPINRARSLVAIGMMLAASLSMAACEDDAADPDGWIVRETTAANGASAEGLPEAGTKVPAGTRMATGNGQFVSIEDGRSQVMLSAASTVTIGDVDPKAGGAKFDLVSGSLVVKPISGKTAETMTISAPHVIVVVHGGAVSISASPEQSMVHVSEGDVMLASTATGDSKTIPVGKMAIATKDGIQVK